MTTFGYARVSTRGQDLNEQVNELKEAGVNPSNIYSEKFTGMTTNRPRFNQLLSLVKRNDTIVVTKLDRFARNTGEALGIIKPLLKNQVTIKVLNLGTIEDTPMGRMITRTLLSVSEMERDMIVERTQAGKEYARRHKANYHEGRPRRVITDQYKAVYGYLNNHTYKDTSKAFNVSISTIQRVKKQIENY